MGNNLKEIRKQIGSVKNTQKTTRAMKLVSTSKLKKAEEMAKRSRLFANKLNEVFDDILSKMKTRGLENINSKYFLNLKDRDIKKVDIIFVTADKGLCGGFNSATIKEVSRLMTEYKNKGIKVRLRGIGKKGIAYFLFNDIKVLDKITDLSSLPDFQRAADFIMKVTQDYLEGLTDEVLIVHNGFKNMISQELKVKVVLPLDFQTQDASSSMDAVSIEPDEEEDVVLEELAKKYIQYNMYYALIDSLAAEHSARMQAMDTATNNAGELVKSLTISYNKARQEAITTELVEINAGVEAMK
ncbi:ATP synthase F1 subunit gamma [Helicobacter cappadocius]|uniref:ATP synthase gamma chain n=1 Tax=Helicobacter cappadocius TaxID=3063998 RepID=A0AA90PSF3_9HELI|nr:MULTISPECIES: ATP synthase F1 subunit gamma [unclassified Helicobacter]MDO7252751.1 ATP synthase F1 subunit gamma [Helicobacter sp. faydin-H75]MDP2538619.1 ATP synthase F1 subunit gamma [Helicobacter sp. faydin-H76]